MEESKWQLYTRLILSPPTEVRPERQAADLLAGLPGYAVGKSVADPKSDHGHMTDALGYLYLGIAKGLLPYSVGGTRFKMYGSA